MIDRRSFLLAGAALAAACARPSRQAGAGNGLEEIRRTLGPGARLGVAALDTGSGRSLSLDADSRYAMCSTFKMPLAAAILAATDRGEMALADEVRFTQGDVLEYAPVVRDNLDRGGLPLEQLCAAAVEVSDNSAANLLLARIGGPEALTGFMRRCGDEVSRLDRTEPALNTNLPGDPRDTTTSAAMLGLMRTLLLGDVLTPASRARLIGWMVGSTTGLERLRAGFPSNWRVGDKTGTGANGAANDIAVAWPPGRSPILVASYISGGDVQAAARNAAHAAVAGKAAAAFA